MTCCLFHTYVLSPLLRKSRKWLRRLKTEGLRSQPKQNGKHLISVWKPKASIFRLDSRSWAYLQLSHRFLWRCSNSVGGASLILLVLFDFRTGGSFRLESLRVLCLVWLFDLVRSLYQDSQSSGPWAQIVHLARAWTDLRKPPRCYQRNPNHKTFAL